MSNLTDLERELLEALRVAGVALADLGACEDPNCPEPICTRALTRVRSAIAAAERKAANE